MIFTGIFFMIVLWACKEKQQGMEVVFPEIKDPEQITKNGKEHFFASYYGINSWSRKTTFRWQPVTYNKEPNFEDYGLGCFLLAGSEVYKLCN